MMSMWKKISLGILTAFFMVMTIGLIGWIGFQEHVRLALKSLQQEFSSHVPSIDPAQQELLAAQEADHAVIETATEARQVVSHIEGLLRSLEEDNIPTE